MSLNPGTRLGTYEILGPLGAGGMGEVYRAKDLRLGREVAVKVLPSEVASSPDRLARFEREARTVAGLNHPNIVTLHSVEDADGIRFLTMELVEGQTLSDLVPAGGLPPSRVLELAIPLADALVAAHERGVIHRDLKPGNVMVTRDGRVKVLDFGLAKMVREDSSSPELTLAATMESPLSSDGQVLGTVPYMAPEQLRGETADARSDLFAFGIMLYELATGRRPFTGDSSAEVASSILRDLPAPLSQVRADVPGDLERIVSHCLEKSPRERVQTALDVNNELRRLRKVLERGEPEKRAAETVASIAVLPFVNRSASADDEYFSDGLADELLNVLAKIRGLHVTARSSSFHFKGKGATVAEVGKVLGVATVLEGSVRKAGNRVRISVQLVQVADSRQLWSETYDRTLEDIFAVQDDIAQSVVKELRTRLLGQEPDSDASGQAKAEVAKAAKGRSTDPEAQRLYLLARHLVERFTREDMAKAIEYLNQALALEPAFALAWAWLGVAYTQQVNHAWHPRVDGIGRARDAIAKGLALEPDLAEGHAAMGWLQTFFDWDFRGAQASYARALELAPGNALALRWAGVLEKSIGRLDEAIRLTSLALEHDPLSASAYFNLGQFLEAADRLPEAEAAFRKALEISPQGAGDHAALSLVLLAQRRSEDALAEATRESDEGWRLWALACTYHGVGRAAESDAALRELIEKYAEGYAYQVATVYGIRGEADSAFEWLERAYAQRDGGLTAMRSERSLRSLVGDSRWGALLTRVGLEGSRFSAEIAPIP